MRQNESYTHAIAFVGITLAKGNDMCELRFNIILCGPVWYISDYGRQAVIERDPAGWRPVRICI